MSVPALICRIASEGTMPENRARPNMVYPGFSFMKRNSLPVRQQPRENVTSKPAVDVMNLTSFIVRSGRRGDRSQVQIPSPRCLKSCAMNFLPHVFFLLALGAADIAQAQSSPSPDDRSAQTANAQMAPSTASPSPSATVSIEPPSLIPPNILPAPDSLPKIPATQELQQLNEFFKKTSLGKVADEHRLHLQMVALETRIRNDQDLHALKATALKVPTDLERRHWLKSYYELYFKKLRALATTPDLKAYLDAQEATRKLSLLQPKVRHESDEAEAAALAKAGAAATAAKALPTPVQARASEVVHP